MPRGVGGREVVQVTVAATSSQKVAMSCIAALTRAACRSNVDVWTRGARLAGGRTLAVCKLPNSLASILRIHIAGTAA